MQTGGAEFCGFGNLGNLANLRGVRELGGHHTELWPHAATADAGTEAQETEELSMTSPELLPELLRLEAGGWRLQPQASSLPAGRQAGL